jgi:hypothetical protein
VAYARTVLGENRRTVSTRKKRRDVRYDLPVNVDQLNRRLIDTRIRYPNDPHGRKLADLNP